ncbi:MAG: hypothetical protein EZS28_027871 [Streblomastix strix]|uniref:Uncharacterized protein n=1 Tax=Streblomastix strix TaxID=222440 RepID=A0A5J4V3H3_9EUKA|nr:MAG: hypothetical protein EZS28_027871 [Streblomastix strix]
MIKGIERNQIHMSKAKKQMSEIEHKELTDEDKIRLQLIDEAISRIKTMPKIGLERSETIGETIDDTSKPKENIIQTGNEIVQIIRGVKTFLQPIIAGKIIKQGGTSNQILLANGDTIDKDKLDYEPIENARYSAIAYVMYETRAWGTLTTQNSRVYISMQITHSNPDTLWQSGYTLFSIVDNAIKPKFSGTPTNIPLNAVLFAQKVYGYPIDWTGAIPIDCFINLNSNVIIYTMCQINLPKDFCVQTIWEAAIKYACESKICR